MGCCLNIHLKHHLHSTKLNQCGNINRFDIYRCSNSSKFWLLVTQSFISQSKHLEIFQVTQKDNVNVNFVIIWAFNHPMMYMSPQQEGWCIRHYICIRRCALFGIPHIQISFALFSVGTCCFIFKNFVNLSFILWKVLLPGIELQTL